VRAKDDGHLDDDAVDLLGTVANALSIALRHARLVQSLRANAHEVSVRRMEAERRLKALERYEDFFEAGADAMLVLDPEGRVLFANRRAIELFGQREEELEAMALSELVDPVPALTPDTLPDAMDVRLTRVPRPLVASVVFGHLLRREGIVLCSLRDVTAQRATEDELRKTKDFLQRVIDASADAIVSADAAGAILLANRAAERLWGRPQQALVGTSVGHLGPQGSVQALLDALRAGGGRVDALRMEVTDATGQRVPVSVSATWLHERDHVVGWVAVFSDLRDRVRMELRLQQAQEQLLSKERQAVIAELAGAAAHELNQPLTSVMGYAELLKRRLAAGSSEAHAAGVIFDEADRMAEIVRKIGRITRYETKSYVGKARILDLERSTSQDGEPAVARKPEGER
jgi:PAS domain S-box-containing protein